MQEILTNLYVRFDSIKGIKTGNYLFVVSSQHKQNNEFIYRVSSVNLVPCNYSFYLSSLIAQMSEDKKRQLFDNARKISETKFQFTTNPLTVSQMNYIYSAIREIFTNLEELPLVKGKQRKYYTNALIGNFFVTSYISAFKDDFTQSLSNKSNESNETIQIVKDGKVQLKP